MRRIILFTALALVFLLMASARFPASLALDLSLPSEALPKDLQLRYAKGTIWEGQVDVVFRTFPATTIAWGLETILPKPSLHITARTHGGTSELSTTLLLTRDFVELQATHFSLASRDSNQLAQEFGHYLAGDLVGESINARLTPRCVDQISGLLRWTGGALSVNTGSRIYRLNTPPMNGELLEQDCGPHAQLYAESEPSAAAVFSVSPTGWFMADISPELIALIDQAGEQPRGSLQFEAKIR